MDMKTWAENEIAIAIEREHPGYKDGDEFDYGVACYKSALKAYNSLMGDGHSGMSISITKNILNRLIEGRPLTPITDKDFEITNPDYPRDIRDNGEEHIQCPRMSSLFKTIYPDGTVSYSDVERVRCVDIHNPNCTYSCGLATRLVDEMFPITLPYEAKYSYTVSMEDFLYDPKHGDFDHQAIFRITRNDGEVYEVNKYYDWTGEIDKELYESRRSDLSYKGYKEKYCANCKDCDTCDKLPLDKDGRLMSEFNQPCRDFKEKQNELSRN